MSKNRKKMICNLVIFIILAVVHYFWGKAIFTFLASVVLYWVAAGFLALSLCVIVVAFVKDQPLWTETDDDAKEFGRIKNESYDSDE